MTKTLAIALLLTWTPGYVLWLTVAGLALAGFGVWQEWQEFRARRGLVADVRWAPAWLAEPALVRVRAAPRR